MREKLIAVLILIVVAGLGYLAFTAGTSNRQGTATSTDSSSDASSTPESQTPITWVDSGHTFIYGLTSRFTVELDSTSHMPSRLACTPSGVIGGISNAPSVASPLFAKRFEVVKEGTCKLADGDFSIEIRSTKDTSLTHTYADAKNAFSLAYPSDAYVSDVSGGALTITDTPLVRIDLARNDYIGTNLSEASVFVGLSKNQATVKSCTDAKAGEQSIGTQKIGGIGFTAYQMRDAGAGNRYDTVSMRSLHAGACYEISTLIHYGVLENYTPGAVRAFDENALQDKLTSIARSFQFTD